MFRSWSVCLASFTLLCTASVNGFAQDGGRLSSDFIPPDAVAAVFYPVQEVLTDPELEMLPIEIFQAKVIEEVGVDPLDLLRIKVVAGMPGPQGPQAGMVIETSKAYQISDLKPQWLVSPEPHDEEGVSVWSLSEIPGAVLYRKDDSTFIVAMGGYLKPMLDADGQALDADKQAGTLAQLVSKLMPRDGINVVAVMDGIRPMVTGLLKQNGDSLPPPLSGWTEFAELTDAMLVNLDYGLMSGLLSVSLLGRDEAAAEELEQLINQSIDFGRDIAVNEMTKNVHGESQLVEEATLKYIDRMSTKLSGLARPKRSGRRVQVDLEGSIATTGVLVALLLPAVQASREAARRMSASNGLKQIGLALHNHHSAYRSLPDRAIRDADGKPLLSWRVAILPFLEANELYDQFHLDEPWDSPHNRTLIPLMPKTFVDPSAPLAPGMTVFQLPVGTEVFFPEEGTRKFRDVIDGLSTTIMVIEANRDQAVEWTKPQDVQVDLDNPLPQFGNSHPGGCHVLFGDGAVKFISSSIDLGTIKAMLTYSGKEPIGR
ncbi:hypothetical protein CA13_69120 [Planctomycetes bacterium CA13]|uniref:DUF1559 domain-containing protein n=1 Tax=Novipirellula herctigrandis TaxID=2527986 RepID=A0A5C5YNS8_9BACT|nr:hypothetical protein CA13_69120 [Planctomycetes bacterium CA13]